jgi:hypothetical protein
VDNNCQSGAFHTLSFIHSGDRPLPWVFALMAAPLWRVCWAPCLFLLAYGRCDNGDARVQSLDGKGNNPNVRWNHNVAGLTQSLCCVARATTSPTVHLSRFLSQDVGAAGTPFLRSTYAAFGDGRDTPAGATRPNPRVISNRVAFADDQPDNDRDMSTLVYVWGQVGSAS